MILNGKQFYEWTENDLLILLDNPDYKENETIDYKANFAFLEIEDKKVVQYKKDEFRHDICSFANVNGGYMFFGISEANGVANSITGIDIPNINVDAFECKLKDIISIIQPVVPAYSIKFILLSSNKYVVVLRVSKGIYKPHVNRENDYFKFYIRRGNEKVCMNYEEIKTMFNKSMELAEQIDSFRKKRIKLCIEKEGVASSMQADAFAIVHFIPDGAFTFQNPINPFSSLINRQINFSHIFSKNAQGQAMPNVDGLVYNYHIYNNSDCKYLQLFKNGIVEKYISIEKCKKDNNNSRLYVRIGSLCDDIKSLFLEVIRYYKTLNHTGTI